MMNRQRPHAVALTAALIALCIGAAPTFAQQSTEPNFEVIERPAGEDEGVFIAQIGNTNRADTDQRGSGDAVRIIQDGQANIADVTQGAGGTHSARIAQDGESNNVLAEQDGAGDTVLLLAQRGEGNVAAVAQTENGVLYSAAAVLQNGNGNSLLLVQNGDDNQARLTQDGDNNAMSATQLNAGNRLDWTQQGDGLSDLQITQQGGSVMQITQTNTGSGG